MVWLIDTVSGITQLSQVLHTESLWEGKISDCYFIHMMIGNSNSATMNSGVKKII